MSIDLDSKSVFSKKHLIKTNGEFTTSSTFNMSSNSLGLSASSGAMGNHQPNAHFTRSVLLSKLTFNLSRGHYNFVCELLKNKAENKQQIMLDPDANEIVTNQKLWLQLETNKLNKQFLCGKTPLILSCYLKESEWAVTISQLLIENGAYLTLRNSSNGCGPLHYACGLLKPELVQLYLRNLTFSLQNARDFNGNTPLVYMLVSFYFYYKRVNLLNNMSKPNNKIKKNAAPYLLPTINENQDVDYNFKEKIESQNKIFQTKCVEALIQYIQHLKKTSVSLNTINKQGFTLQDFYNKIVSHCPNIASHEFFQVMKTALDEAIKENPAEKSLKLPSINNELARNNETDSFLYESSTFKTDLTSFFKSNLLLDLNDMKNYKIIVHSKKNDDELTKLYLKKRIRDRLSSGASYVPPKDSEFMNQLADSTGDNEPPGGETKSAGTAETRSYLRGDSTWRDRFYTFYNYLEVSNSDSYRKGIKITFQPSQDSINLPQIPPGKAKGIKAKK